MGGLATLPPHPGTNSPESAAAVLAQDWLLLTLGATIGCPSGPAGNFDCQAKPLRNGDSLHGDCVPRSYGDLRAHGSVFQPGKDSSRSASSASGPRNGRCTARVLSFSGRLRVGRCIGSGGWDLVVSPGSCGGRGPGPLLRGRGCVASTRR